MIVESSAQSSFSYSQILEKNTAAPMDNKATPLDNPPAYSDLGNELGHSSSSSGFSSRGYNSRGSSRGRRGRHGNSRQNLPRQPEPLHSDGQCGHDVQAFANSSPSPTVDQVHIYDKKHNIEGTFYIDPMVPMLDPSRRHKSKSNETLPHASFRTHHNTIDLKLGTTGDVHRAGKVNVNVSSRDGFVNVTMLPTPPSRPRMGLNISSRHGTVAVFIPEDFVGMIQLASRKGALKVLPNLAGRMKTIKSSDREIIFIIGNASDDFDGSREASFCDLSTRSGDIVVGLSGRDQYVPPVGFWQKLGGLLKG